MTFVAKVLVGIAGVVTFTSIGAVVAYRESIFGNSWKEISDLKGRCFVIPTNSDNNQTELLICKPTDSFSTNSQYSLYKKGAEVEKNELVEIKKKGNNLEVSWKNQESSSDESDSNTKKEELQIKGESWESIREGENLISACDFVSNAKAQGGEKWQCSGSSVEGSAEKEFQLTPFLG